MTSTSDAPKIPPNPEPFVETDAKVRGEWGHYALFTASQMNERYLQAWRDALELAAQAVEAKTLRDRRISGWLNGEPMKPCELAAALRAIPMPKHE